MAYVEKTLFTYNCRFTNRRIIVSKYTYDDVVDNDVYFTVGLIEGLPFFKRLWIGLHSAFKRNDPETIAILSPEKTKSLVKSLQNS